MDKHLAIAKVFEKRHADILRIIKQRIKRNKERGLSHYDLNIGNAKLRYQKYTYISGKGRKVKAYYYLIDRNIFMDITMPFAGDKAYDLRWAFIEAFEAMERKLSELDITTDDIEELKRYRSLAHLLPKAENFGELSVTGNGCARVDYRRAYAYSNKKKPLSVLQGQKEMWLKGDVPAGIFGEWSDEDKRVALERIEKAIQAHSNQVFKEGMERKEKHAYKQIKRCHHKVN